MTQVPPHCSLHSTHKRVTSCEIALQAEVPALLQATHIFNSNFEKEHNFIFQKKKICPQTLLCFYFPVQKEKLNFNRFQKMSSAFFSNALHFAGGSGPHKCYACSQAAVNLFVVYILGPEADWGGPSWGSRGGSTSESGDGPGRGPAAGVRIGGFSRGSRIQGWVQLGQHGGSTGGPGVGSYADPVGVHKETQGWSYWGTHE